MANYDTETLLEVGNWDLREYIEVIGKFFLKFPRLLPTYPHADFSFPYKSRWVNSQSTQPLTSFMIFRRT